MKSIKIAWFLPFRYVAPADLENYYERMEAAGWHVNDISQFHLFCQPFIRQAPKTYRYVVDLNASLRTKDYESTYEAFGWELVGKMASMFVWRMEYAGKRPEAFTDPASVAQRSYTIARVLLGLILFIVAQLAVITVLFFALKGWQSAGGVAGYGVTAGLSLGLMVVLIVVRHIVLRNRNR